MLQRLADAGLVKGKTVGIDATTLEANAALRSIVRRDNGESYDHFGSRPRSRQQTHHRLTAHESRPRTGHAKNNLKRGKPVDNDNGTNKPSTWRQSFQEHQQEPLDGLAGLEQIPRRAERRDSDGIFVGDGFISDPDNKRSVAPVNHGKHRRRVDSSFRRGYLDEFWRKTERDTRREPSQPPIQL